MNIYTFWLIAHLLYFIVINQSFGLFQESRIWI